MKFSPLSFSGSKPAGVLAIAIFLGACGGTAPETAVSDAPNTASAPVSTAVVLRPPVLSFRDDTGLSVTDGITGNGIWDVASDINWEFSLDQGTTWTRGTGSSFEVTGDGAKIIWVRSWDDAGNKSEIVRVNCVLDTTAPTALGIAGQTEGVTNSLRLSSIEPGARWEYSLDEQRSWVPGQCSALGILGNNLSRIWLRQMDLAGNTSSAQFFDLQGPNVVTHEASGDPMRPSVLTPGLQTYLIHGVVVRGDADFVTWDIPKGQQLLSVKLMQYVSDDAIAFYALQRKNVFDAVIDLSRMMVDESRMLVYGHMGPGDLGRNVLANMPKSQLGKGAMTLWFQQTGLLPARYVVEVLLGPAN